MAADKPVHPQEGLRLSDMSSSIQLPGLAALARSAERRSVSHTASGAPPTLHDLDVRRNEILSLATKNGASNVRVFGSVARGEAGATSDLDLLIDLETGRSLLDIAGLVVDLEDLLGCEVNVTRAGALRRPEVRERILAEAIPL